MSKKKLFYFENRSTECNIAFKRSQVATASYSGNIDSQGGYTCPRAVMQSKSGAEWIGRMVNGFMHGKGTLTLPRGLSYEGTVTRNKLTGLALLKYKGAEYCGYVDEGLHNGKGTCSFADGPMLYAGTQ